MPHINIAHTKDGRNVQLQITDPPKSEIRADISATNIGHFVTGVLGACIDCAKTTGEFAKLKLKETEKKKLMYVHANEVAITDALDVADTVVLVFAIGATELSIGIHKDGLAALGKAFWTLSADQKKKQ